MNATLLVCDVLSLAAAPVLAHAVWVQVNPAAPKLHLMMWPSLFFFLAVYALEGLYPAGGMTPVEQLRRVTRSTCVVYLVLTAGMFMAKDIGILSRGVFLLSWGLSLALVPMGRAAARGVMAERSWWGIPVVVLGAGETGRRVIRQLRAEKSLGLKPVAVLDDSGQAGWVEGVPFAGGLYRLTEMAVVSNVNYAILAMPGMGREKMLEVLETCSKNFAHVMVIPNLFGMSSLWVSARDLGGILGLEVSYNLLVPVNRWLKRAMDIVLAAILGVIAVPIIVISAVVLKLVSPGNALYRQERIGHLGRRIQIPKLRTMRCDAEESLRAYLEKDAAAREEWGRYFKLKKDPRIVPVIGRLARRMSIDELPQLWSVIKGEMSLVGPRPFPQYHTEKFDEKFQQLRQQAIPGLTGLWQITARSDGDLGLQSVLDTYYIRNWSVWLDLYILLKTAHVVVAGRGAY